MVSYFLSAIIFYLLILFSISNATLSDTDVFSFSSSSTTSITNFTTFTTDDTCVYDDVNCLMMMTRQQKHRKRIRFNLFNGILPSDMQQVSNSVIV
jgi:hypothetical protein